MAKRKAIITAELRTVATEAGLQAMGLQGLFPGLSLTQASFLTDLIERMIAPKVTCPRCHGTGKLAAKAKA